MEFGEIGPTRNYIDHCHLQSSGLCTQNHKTGKVYVAEPHKYYLFYFVLFFILFLFFVGVLLVYFIVSVILLLNLWVTARINAFIVLNVVLCVFI